MNSIFLKSAFNDTESEMNRPEWLSIVDHKNNKQNGGSMDLNKLAMMLDSEANIETERTEDLENKLRNLLSGQNGGAKKKSKVDVEVKGKKKASKKRSRKMSKKGGAKKKSKKVSKKGSKKRKQRGGNKVYGVRNLKGGMSDSEEMEVESESEDTPIESSESSEETKPVKKSSGRSLPPALVKRQEVQKHIGAAVKAAGMKYNVGKIAKVVSKVIEDSNAGSGADMDPSKAKKHFDSNKSKYMSDL